ncbi:MAG: hypothetical protein ABIC18_02090 [Candidatus Omnitrophota bacterium]
MKTVLLYNPDLKKYGFGPEHPFRGDRFAQFFDFFNSKFGRFHRPFEVIKPHQANDAMLELVHTREYIKAIQSASRGQASPDISRYISADNLEPSTGCIPRGIEEGARIIVGTSVLAGQLCVRKSAKKIIGIGGGMHHAKPQYGEGFCFYNDIAICVKSLIDKYNLKRVLVLDTDAHPGNGTKEIFFRDREVLFIDIHQDPRTIYPGNGFISEIGGGNAEGFTVNLCLMPGASNSSYKYLFEDVIFPLANEFQPQLIIRYGGSDPHYLDELTKLGLTIEGFRMIGRQVNRLAESLTEGRSVDLLLSGYNLAVLPFAWSALICGLLDLDMDLSGLKEEPPMPPDYRLEDARDMVKQLKKLLKNHWQCMN